MKPRSQPPSLVVAPRLSKNALAVLLALVVSPAAALPDGPLGDAPILSRRELPLRFAMALEHDSSSGDGRDAYAAGPAEIWVRDGSKRDLASSSMPRMDSAPWGTDGTVNAIVRAGRTVYIGGTFSSVAPTTGGGVPMHVSSGCALPRFPKVNGGVNTVVADGRGGWFIGGSFTEVGGLPRACLAHIRADGRVSSWRADAAPFVFALLLKGDTLFVGGRFYYVAGQPRTCLAALSVRTGAVLSWAPNPSGDVYALVLHGNTLYVGGGFGGISGQRRTYLAALDATTGAATNWDPNPYHYVFAIAADDSTVFAGGHFTVLAGQSRNYLAAIDARTGTLRSWTPNPNGSVFTLTLMGRTLFALGWFNTIGGRPRNGAAAIDALTGEVLSWVPDSSVARVVALAIRGHTMYAGWYLASPRRNGIAALDIETGAAQGWQTSTNNFVNVLALDGNVLYAGGYFSRLGASSTRANLAALDANTGEVLPWNPDPDGSSVNALAAYGRTVYVGGDFTRIGGRALSGFAAVDARDGRASRAELSTDGPVEVLETHGCVLFAGGSFSRLGGLARNNVAAVELPAERVTPWDPGTNGPVRALAADEHRVYIGGSYDRIGGGTGLLPRNHLAAVDAATGAVAPWDPNASGSVSALALSGDILYVGGRFSNIGGQARDAIAAVDATSGSTLSWDPNAGWLGAHAVPRHAMAVMDSTVYVGGSFAWIGGASRRGFAALDAHTALATDWDPRTGWFVGVIVPCERAIYLGGHFGQAGGYPADNLAAFSIPRAEAEHRVQAAGGEDQAVQPPRLALSVSNPARGTGEIRFSLPEGAPVSLSVFDLQGRKIATLLNHTWLGAGQHAVDVPAQRWPSGLYLCRIEVGGSTATQKLIVDR